MKSLLIFSLFLSQFSVAATKWNPVAKTTDCPVDVKVKASEGKKHVLVEMDGRSFQLESQKDEAYSPDALVSHEFKSNDNKMRLILPGYVERNPPKFDVVENGKKIHCRMNLL